MDKVYIRCDVCTGCGKCVSVCPEKAIICVDSDNFSGEEAGLSLDCDNCTFCRRSCRIRDNFLIKEMTSSMESAMPVRYQVIMEKCTGCGQCVGQCPVNAIIARET